ncbi:MAG: MFS transporter [Ardenticatenaceae bacterium]|nr:MFS transporter [Ardenticatenaceae bacterium]
MSKSENHTLAEQNPSQLSFVQKLAYGVGDVGPALVATLSGFYLNAFLLDVAGLRPSMAALIFLLVKIWDSVNDPVIGTLTDRTNTRWGRRRPWLLFGAVPFGLAWFLQWQVPALSDTGLFFYYLVVALLLDTALTAVNVPYTALTPEIASAYNERTSLNSFRFSFSILGGLASLVIHDMLLRAAETVVRGYVISAAIMGIVIIVTNLITFAAIKESYVKDEAEPEPGFLEGFRIAFSNRPFVMVTAIYLMSWLAIQFVQANMLLYVRYWMGTEDQFIILAMCLQISIFLFLLVWTKVSERIGKRHVYFIGVSLWIVVELVLYFVQPGQMTLLIILAILAGVGASVAYLIPWSMLPDVVDVDELNTGLRREGVYYGFFVFLQKLGISLGLAIANVVFEWAGYINAVPGEAIPVQPDSVQLALRLFVSFVPAVILLLSFPIVYKYPITRERHAEIQAELAARKI